MLKKLLLSLIIFISFLDAGLAQPITVSGIATAGRFNTCTFGPPTITATLLPTSTGTSVTPGGTLVCTDPCGTSKISIILGNVRWNQTPGVNWIHGLFFPANAGYTVNGVTLPAGWVTLAGATGAPCSAQITGGPGFYFDGYAGGTSCCGTAIPFNGNAGDNWGDGFANCPVQYNFQFELEFCNRILTGGSQTFKIRGTADGGTGCWSVPDIQTHEIQYTLATQACNPVLFTPSVSATGVRTCTGGTPNYIGTYNGGCGNGSTITWWTAAVGGTQVGSGSPFVYDPPGTACPGTLYAQCCPTGSTCESRKAVGVSCTAPLTITNVLTTNPSCSSPNASIDGVTVTGAVGTVTYTLNPGGFSNTTGVFPGLTGTNYTLTATDGTGCAASVPVTFTPGSTGGPAPTVTSPVNYCQNAAATPLTATGTNLLWYTAATGGVGSATAPTPSTTTPGSTNYYVSQTFGGCESPRALITVNVTGVVTVTLSSPAATTNQTICINTPLTNITYSTTGNPTGVNATGLPAGVTGTYNAGTGVFTISGTPTVAGSFPYNVTTTGGCSSATQNGTITVSPIATLTLSSAAATTSQVICINTPLTNITYTVGGGATGATVTPLPAGVTGTYSAGVFTIGGTSTVAGTFPYTVTTTGGCGSATSNGTITVNPAATLTLTSAAATTNQTICVNTALSNITYATGGGATGATVTALPAGVTGTFSGGIFTISGTPTATGTFPYTVTTTGGCGTASLSGTITVSTAATLTLSSAASTTTQTICINTALTNITYNVGGGATSATVTGLPAGVSGIYSAGVFTISGTPTVSGPFSYTVTTVGGCGTVSLSGTITVTPDATLTLTSAPATTTQTVCVNTALTNITYATGGSATGATVTGLPGGVTGTFAGGVFTISGTPTATGTFPYTVTTTGGCSTASLSGTITVSTAATLTLSSPASTTNQTLCVNTAITNITYNVGGGATSATVTGLPAGVSGTYSAGVFTISGTPTVSGPFSYAVTTVGGCGTVTLSGSITVTPDATITLTSAPATTTQTICVNTALTNITYTIGGSATGATVTGLPAGVTGTFSGGVFTISGTPTATGTFGYTVTTSGGCGSAALSGTITVNSNVTLVLTSAAGTTNQTVSINTPITNITYTAGGGATGVTVTGLPTGVTGTFSGGVFTISGTPTVSGTFNYSVTTTGGCGSVTLMGTIIVNDQASITLTSGPGSNNQTICITASIVNITYSVGGGATGAAITAGALPPGVTGSFSAGVYTISGTPTASGTFNYTVTTTGGVGTASLSGTIIVNPAATIALTSAPATTSQTVCVNTAITNITYATGNGATGATVTGLPAGVTGNYAGGVFTISGTPTVAGSFPYTVTTTGGCGSASLTGTITINPAATISLTSAAATAAQSICINTALTNITYSTANGATGATVSGLPAGVTGTFSGGVFTISGTPSLAGTFPYTVTTTGGCSTASLSGTITVNPNVTITLSSAASTTTQSLCINTALTDITYTTSNGATGATVTGLPTGVTGTFSGGVFTISGSPSVAGTFNYMVTTTGGCSTASLSGTITVNPAATITLTSAGATTSQVVCINTVITNITYATATGATGATVTGLPAGVTGTYSGGVFTISGTPTVAGTFPYTVTTTGGCGTASLGGTITVNPNVIITLTSAAGTANQTACINTAITNIVYTTANGATGVTVTGLPAGVTGIFSGGVFTISGTPTVTGTFNYTVTTTGGCSSAMLSGTIIVNPAATIALTSAAATTSQTLCVNTALTNITYSTGNGATGATVTGLPAGVMGTYSGGVFTISGTPTVAGTFNYTVSTTGGCATASLTGTITVNPAATITLTSGAATAAQSVCINTSLTNITYTTANGATGATVIGLPAGVTGTFSGGVFTISGTPTVTGTFNYTVTTTGGCSTASLSGTITVNANVTLTLSSAASTTTQSLCINTALTNITYTTSNGATGATVTGLPAGVTGTFSGGVFTISGSPSVAGTFNYTVTTTGGCSTASLSGTITVNPAATITLTSAPATTSQSVCINTAITNITYATATGATGATVTGLPAGVTGTYSGGVFTISGTPTVGGTFNYTVTTSGGCGTASLSGTITVNPNVTITLTSAAGTANQTGCINTAITDIVYTTANGATGVTVTGLPAGVTGTFSGGVFTISGTPTVTGTFPYTVLTSGGCSTATLSGTIIVNPAATIALTSAAATTSQTLCVNTALTNIIYNTANGATGATVTGLPAGVTGTYAGSTFTISGTPTVAGTFPYTVTTTGGCATASLSGTITVVAIPPAPTVVSPVNYCPGVPATALTATGTNLLWYTTATGGTGSTNAPIPNTATSGTTSYYVSQSTGACEGPRAQINVIVDNSLMVSIGPDTTICQGDKYTFQPVVTPTPTAYAWRALNVPASTIDNPAIANAAVSPVDDAIYVLRVSLNGCSKEDTAQVNVRWKPIVDAGINAAICKGDSTLLIGSVSHTTSSAINFAWTPIDSLTTPDSIITYAHPIKNTWYKLTATTTIAGYGCVFSVSDSVKVVIPPTVIAFAGNDTIAVKGVPHQLHGTGGTNYTWSSPTATLSNPFSQNPLTTLNNDANFFLKVENAIGCAAYDTLFVKVFEGPEFYMPNAFSPNGDGLNDILRGIPAGIANILYFRVFNRYGELMFETNQWLKGWDGTYKGKPQPNGVYVWMVKGVDRNNFALEKQGTVMIIR